MGKLDADDKSTLESAVKETLEWLDSNPGADKDEFDEQYKSLEKIAQPIFTKFYQQNGGAPGGPEGDMGGHDEL